MKRLILLITLAIISVGCNKNDKDCDCSRQRWERKATYTVANGTTNPVTPSVFVSATEWQKIGNTESIESDDCNQNGIKINTGNTGSVLSSDGTKYTTTEFEYRITCQ